LKQTAIASTQRASPAGIVELEEQAAVAIQGDGDQAVPHAHLDRLRVGAGGDRQGDAGVAQVVEPAVNAGLGQRPLRHVRLEAGVDQRRAGGRGEHQRVVGRAAGEVLGERGGGVRRDGDRADPGVRLRRTTVRHAVDELQLLGDAHLAAHEVDLAAAKPDSSLQRIPESSAR